MSRYRPEDFIAADTLPPDPTTHLSVGGRSDSHSGTRIGANIGAQMQLRKVDWNEELRCAIWRQDMDGFEYGLFPGDMDDPNRLVVITEMSYRNMVRSVRRGNLNPIKEESL